MKEKYLALAKKLKALADKGIGGEKVNAEEMLNALLKKHNLTYEEIEGEKLQDYYFTLNKEEGRLWSQICKRVNVDLKCYGPFPSKDVKRLRLEGNNMARCTASEYIEIESMFHLYSRLYKQEIEIFYKAFCTANDLLASGKVKRSTSELSPEELEEWKRAQAMAEKIKKESYRKQLAK
jgi:hypothetical protein